MLRRTLPTTNSRNDSIQLLLLLLLLLLIFLQVGKGYAQATVWTRQRLAELCDISEAQLVELALVIGTKYTAFVPPEALHIPDTARTSAEAVSIGEGMVLGKIVW